jgi:hypothetical protein
MLVQSANFLRYLAETLPVGVDAILLEKLITDNLTKLIYVAQEYFGSRLIEIYHRHGISVDKAFTIINEYKKQDPNAKPYCLSRLTSSLLEVNYDCKQLCDFLILHENCTALDFHNTIQAFMQNKIPEKSIWGFIEKNIKHLGADNIANTITVLTKNQVWPANELLEFLNKYKSELSAYLSSAEEHSNWSGARKTVLTHVLKYIFNSKVTTEKLDCFLKQYISESKNAADTGAYLELLQQASCIIEQKKIFAQLLLAYTKESQDFSITILPSFIRQSLNIFNSCQDTVTLFRSVFDESAIDSSSLKKLIIDFMLQDKKAVGEAYELFLEDAVTLSKNDPNQYLQYLFSFKQASLSIEKLARLVISINNENINENDNKEKTLILFLLILEAKLNNIDGFAPNESCEQIKNWSYKLFISVKFADKVAILHKLQDRNAGALCNAIAIKLDGYSSFMRDIKTSQEKINLALENLEDAEGILQDKYGQKATLACQEINNICKQIKDIINWKSEIPLNDHLHGVKKLCLDFIENNRANIDIPRTGKKHKIAKKVANLITLGGTITKIDLSTHTSQLLNKLVAAIATLPSIDDPKYNLEPTASCNNNNCYTL